MRHFTVRQFAKACQAQYFGPEEVLEQEIHGCCDRQPPDLKKDISSQLLQVSGEMALPLFHLL